MLMHGLIKMKLNIEGKSGGINVYIITTHRDYYYRRVQHRDEEPLLPVNSWKPMGYSNNADRYIYAEYFLIVTSR